MKIPSAPANSPLIMDSRLSTAINTSATTTSENMSAGPILVDQSASGLASRKSTPQEINPPTKEAVMPKPSARPGRPPFAIGNPSRVVMIEAGVPGIRSRVAVINPPLTEPTYMATNSANAYCGSMPKVSGTASEIAMAPVNPGTAPTSTPPITPTQIQMRRTGSMVREDQQSTNG